MKFLSLFIMLTLPVFAAADSSAAGTYHLVDLVCEGEFGEEFEKLRRGVMKYAGTTWLSNGLAATHTVPAGSLPDKCLNIYSGTYYATETEIQITTTGVTVKGIPGVANDEECSSVPQEVKPDHRIYKRVDDSSFKRPIINRYNEITGKYMCGGYIPEEIYGLFSK